MTKIVIFILIGGFILGVIKLIFDSPRREQSVLYGDSFAKKKYFLTLNELRFFRVLEQIIKDKYYIFPQVHINSLITPNGYGKIRYGNLNRIIKKSVDFVIADKQNLSPIVVIELDDSTHEKQSRIDRDDFVNELFQQVNIKLVRIPVQKEYDVVELIRMFGISV